MNVTDKMVEAAMDAYAEKYQPADWTSTVRAAITAALSAMEGEAGTPTPVERSGGIVAAFEAAYPELYWHIAKGKICAGEPLYGAIITTMGTTEIGHGESDVSADEAFRIAVENAGLVLAASEGSTDGN